MTFDKATQREIAKMAVGQALAAVLICLVYLLLQKLTGKVAISAFYGAAVATGYFISICWSVFGTLRDVPEDEQLDKAQKAAKGSLRGSYLVRLLLVGGALLLAFKSPLLEGIPAAIPFFLVRPIATFTNPFKTKEEQEK